MYELFKTSLPKYCLFNMCQPVWQPHCPGHSFPKLPCPSQHLLFPLPGMPLPLLMTWPGYPSSVKNSLTHSLSQLVLYLHLEALTKLHCFFIYKSLFLIRS